MEKYFRGTVWLIYGKLRRSKDELTQHIEQHGGRVVSSISKQLNVLVWAGETLLPGDEVTSVKPRDALQAGALVLGENDLDALLAGNPPARVEAYWSSRSTEAPTPKKTTAKTKTLDTSARLTPEALAERTCLSIGRLVADERQTPQFLNINACIAHCLERGRRDLAKRMADALPKGRRGHAALLLAQTEEEVFSASHVVLAEVSGEMTCSVEACTSDRGPRLGAALQMLSRMSPTLAPKLLPQADAFLEGALSERIAPAGIVQLLGALIEQGERERARRALERWLQHGAMLTHNGEGHYNLEASLDEVRGLVWAFPEDAAFTRRLVAACPQESARTTLVDDEGLLEISRTGAFRAEHAQELIAAGRSELARRCFAARAERFPDTPFLAAERHLIFGEQDEARAILAKLEEPRAKVATMRIEVGIESSAQVRERLAAADGSVMSRAFDLVEVGMWLLKRDPNDPEIDRMCDEAARISATPPALLSLQYDQGIAATAMEEAAKFRFAIFLARGDQAGARQWLEQDDFAARQKAVRMPRDRRQEIWARNQLAGAFMVRAGAVDALELVKRALPKVTKEGRSQLALETAHAFLPHAPLHALEALDLLSTDSAAVLLGMSEECPSLLKALWLAVLP